jgi:hypothetical protein
MPEPRPIQTGFDYAQFDSKLAETIRDHTVRICRRGRRALVDIIETGNNLLAVKKALPHGKFLPWLRVECHCWSERSARNFIEVGVKFKSATVANLTIQPKAAYILAGPSIPDETVQKAIQRAKAGENITLAVAKAIVAETQNEKDPKVLKINVLAKRLETIIERYRARWDPNEHLKFDCLLTRFVGSVVCSRGLSVPLFKT